MKKKGFPDWFELKKFTHLTPKTLSYSKEYFYSIYHTVNDKDYIATHAFYPLIHYDINFRKLEKDKNGKLIKDNDGKIKHKVKKRTIHFPTHLDCFIYAYYAYNKGGRLGEKYEQKVSANPEFSECVCAYRKNDSGRRKNSEITYKCNIDYAKELFDEISNVRDCCVLTFDIKDFFPSINHNELKKKWAEIIDLERLPPDDFNIFKSITNFHYIDETELIKKLKFKHKKEVYRQKILSYFDNPKDFRKFIDDNNIRIKENPFKYKKTNKWNIPHSTFKGIPQGTPLSPLLSNIYLLAFDKEIYEEIVLKRNGFYRRYSDDVAIICKEAEIDEIKKIVTQQLDKCKLELHSSKTKIFKFEDKDGRINCKRIDNNSNTNKIDYLGLEFDGKNIYLKTGSLSKYYRKMKKLIALKANRAGMKESNGTFYSDFDISRRGMKASKDSFTGKGIFKEVIYNNFTNFGDSNFITYANRVYEITKSKAVLNQIRKHRKIIKEEIENYSYNDYNEEILGIMELFNKYHNS